MAFLLEPGRLPARAQEVLAAADHARAAAVRRSDRAVAGLGRGAVHLHAVLTGAHPRPVRVLSRQRCGAARRRPHRGCGAGGALHPQEARCAVSQNMRSHIAWRKRIALDDVDYVVFYEKPFLKFERLLETYVAFAPRGFRSFATAIPVWMREKLFQKDFLRRELQEVGAGLRLAEEAPVHRAPSQPRRQRLLRLAFPGGGGADDGRRRRMVHDVELRSARGTRPADHARDAFSALARAALFRLHLLHRLQGQLRRVQGHGPCALRRAEISRSAFSIT